MKKVLRLLALGAAAAGAAMIGYALSVGFQRGFGFDLELGNWTPVFIGAGGTALFAAGAFAYAYFGHPDAGVRRRKALVATLRRAAVLGLTLTQGAGVAGSVYGFIMFLATSRTREPSLWALGLCACGIVAWRTSSLLLRWAKGPPAPAKETSVARFDDQD